MSNCYSFAKAQPREALHVPEGSQGSWINYDRQRILEPYGKVIGYLVLHEGSEDGETSC